MNGSGEVPSREVSSREVSSREVSNREVSSRDQGERRSVTPRLSTNGALAAGAELSNRDVSSFRFTDSPLIVNYSDDLQVEKIMNTLEKQDHLLYHSMNLGISVDEYKYQLLQRLAGK